MPPALYKAVILGAAGFIGTNLAHALIRRGAQVMLFDRNLSPHWPAAAEVLVGDLATPPAALLAAMAGATVFHAAGHTRPAVTTAELAMELQSEITATTALLEQSRNIDCRWLFISSGGAVYGQAQTPRIAETHPTEPISSYGIAKLAMEKYFHLYGTLYGTRYLVARLGNPFGPFQRTKSGQGIVPAIVGRLRRGETIEIWGDGSAVRDYLYVEDAVTALLRLAENGRDGRVYNVGSGVGTSIEQLVDLVAAELGFVPHIARHPGRRIDVRRNVLDITRIGEDTGWTPLHTLGQGLSKACSWLDATEARNNVQ